MAKQERQQEWQERAAQLILCSSQHWDDVSPRATDQDYLAARLTHPVTFLDKLYLMTAVVQPLINVGDFVFHATNGDRDVMNRPKRAGVQLDGSNHPNAIAHGRPLMISLSLIDGKRQPTTVLSSVLI